MPGKAVDYLQRLYIPREIENSRRFRAAVWLSVCISLLALALQGVASKGLVATAILLITLGSFLAWRRRHNRNLAVKAVIALLTLAALASFLRQVGMQPYDPRLPLAELFVWIQVLHSFDQPRRMDLMLSLVSSLILLALAGSFTLSASFAWIVLLWLAAALPSLYFAQMSRLRSLSSSPERTRVPSTSWKSLAFALVFLLVIVTGTGLALGAVIPRVNATYLRALPFSLRRAFNPSNGFSFENPGYPNLPMRPPDEAMQVNPESYFGFSPFLDLRARGKLLNLPVMKVRSTEAAYWGGMSFRDYNGYSWLTAEETPALLHVSSQPFVIEYDYTESHLSGRRVIQTFYVETDQPNIIFAASRPDLVYFPADYLYQDSSGLKSPFELSSGLIYSAVSDRVYFDEAMANAAPDVPEGKLQPYLDLPDIPERVRALTEEVVPEGVGPYARAGAIEDYLKRSYSYSLDVPALPRGRDAVDYFLFEQRRGYCEHFASAYAVMCRMAGVPSRVVTGYSTGEYNPFSGLYEVSLVDAHAWVEIYIQGIGWISRDPTPGFSVPHSQGDASSLWIFGDFMSWMGRRISSLVPASLRSALKTGFSAFGSAVSSLFSGIAYSSSQAPWLPALFIALMLSLLLLFRARRRPRGRIRAAGSAGAVLVMQDFLVALEGMGLTRKASQTVEEYLDVIRLLLPSLSLSKELQLFEGARYGGHEPPAEEVRTMRQSLDDALVRVRDTLKSRRIRRIYGSKGPPVSDSRRHRRL